MWHDNETDKDFLGFVVHERLVRNVRKLLKSIRG